MTVCLPAGRLAAQVPYDMQYAAEAMNYREEISLFTDRNLYAVNEPVYFRSFYKLSGSTGDLTWSRVLYVDLVSPSGQKLAGGKFFHDRQGSSGYLTIPPTAVTGTYYLRAYTRWMRNFGPLDFAYVPLLIINPFTAETLDMQERNAGSSLQEIPPGEKSIRCLPSRPRYLPGEEIDLALEMEGPGTGREGRVCITVVPAGTVDSLVWNSRDPGRDTDPPFRFDFLPEIRGISLSGRLQGDGKADLMPEYRLHFPITGPKSGYLATLADRKGRFVVTLPERYGKQEFFVAVEPVNGLAPQILIDQEFSPDPVPFTVNPFRLDSVTREQATRFMINMQLGRAFGQAAAGLPDTISVKDNFPFLSVPAREISLEEFVDLPTMTEVFENLVMGVLVRNGKDGPRLVIKGENPNIAMIPPLVLVDKIPVFDVKAIQALDPSRIRKIAYINEVYVMGDMMIGGIVMITTRQNDMAAVDLPAGSYFFDYQAYDPGNLRTAAGFNTEPGVSRHLPGEEGQPPAAGERHMPDLRNTLFWLDQAELTAGKASHFQFRAGQAPGEYLVLVRGQDGMGRSLYGTGRFVIEPAGE